MAKEKVKKPFYKKWWVWLLAIIIIAGAASGGEEESSTPASTEPKAVDEGNSKTSSTSNAQDQQKTEPKAGVLTKEKFDHIENGMTYEEVVSIIGSEGVVISETGDKGSQFHTVMYEFETDGFMSNANMMFQGGKLVSKAQVGLGGGSSVEVSLEQFNQLQNGMTLEEVTKIVGGQGEIISETGEKGTEFYTVMYSYPGKGSLGANVTLMFQGNKLQNKSQFGLE
ncbi:hypothetical protein [Peribacillus tepidiphilus]|uniref:hypothetical protein n=1 Tax=Peribacillus tepidiphilus TaxID=2652445 RepID=UPI0035B56DC2